MTEQSCNQIPLHSAAITSPYTITNMWTLCLLYRLSGFYIGHMSEYPVNNLPMPLHIEYTRNKVSGTKYQSQAGCLAWLVIVGVIMDDCVTESNRMSRCLMACLCCIILVYPVSTNESVK